MRPSREHGFTLIEVLLALAILSLVMSMVYTSFDQTAQSIRHIDKFADPYRSGRVVLAKMSDEIMSAFFFADDPATRFLGTDNSGTESLDGDSLEFTSLAGVREVGAVGSNQTALRYYLSNGRLMYSETPNALAVGERVTQTYPLIDNLSGFRLRYLADDGAWRDGWGGDTGTRGLPLAVEVSLFYPAMDTDDVNPDVREDAEFLELSTLVRVPMRGV